MFFATIVVFRSWLGEPRQDALLEDLAETDLRDAHVAVRVAFHLGEIGEIVRVDAEHHAFGDHRDAVETVMAAALHDRAGERVHE